MNSTLYKKILSQPARKAIVKSILSRENASRVAAIAQDTGMRRETVHHHLNTLIATDILMSDIDFSDVEHRGRYVYFISYTDEALQEVLCELFPELMSEVS